MVKSHRAFYLFTLSSWASGAAGGAVEFENLLDSSEVHVVVYILVEPSLREDLVCENGRRENGSELRGK